MRRRTNKFEKHYAIFRRVPLADYVMGSGDCATTLKTAKLLATRMGAKAIRMVSAGHYICDATQIVIIASK